MRELSLRKVAKKVLPDLVDFTVDALGKALNHRRREPKEKGSEETEELEEPVEGRSFEGQTEISYCLECLLKHSQTAKVLMREALQRAEAGTPRVTGVQEKVRGVVEELCGFEDDSDTLENEGVTGLNTMARELRKYIYTSRAEIGGASMEQLREIKRMVDQLVDASYMVAQVEECAACRVEDICGGDAECVEFLAEASEKVKTREEWEEFLEEAKKRYKGV